MSSVGEKKRVEAGMLDAARKAGVPIPVGEIPGEEPDFRFDTGLGIELSELIRPAGSNHGILPVEEAAFHSDVVRLAEEAYYRMPDAKPVKVGLFFRNARGKRQDKRQVSNTVAEFVRSKADQATPFADFDQFDAPEGFVVITITAERAPWFNSECGGVTFSEIQPQVADRINAKNKLVRTYRANLPQGAQVWLLLYTAVTVPRSMPIPYGIEDWKFPFDFDRVFWFASLEKDFVEINRA
jgi:hypothetical protein